MSLPSPWRDRALEHMVHVDVLAELAEVYSLPVEAHEGVPPPQPS